MSLTRIASATALAGILTLAAACGGSSGDSDQGALGSTVGSSPTTAAPVTPTPTPTKKPHATASPSPTPTGSPTAGDGDSVGDDEPFTAGGGVCGKLTASQVGTVIGSGVRGAGLPGGGCEFDHVDAKAPSVTVKDTAYAGMEAAKTDATSAVEGEPQDLSGIGSGAFVVTGTVFGGNEVQGAGAVHVGSRTLSVWVIQHKALSETAVRDLVVRMLRLVAAAAR
ncbi:hypothetical protein [Marmoricola sp. URHA0025 HA25]